MFNGFERTVCRWDGAYILDDALKLFSGQRGNLSTEVVCGNIIFSVIERVDFARLD
jgi:hypothetical protein